MIGPDDRRWNAAGDLLSRGILGGLYVALCRSLLLNFLQTGRVTGLLLLVSESLVIVFTLFRRRTQQVDRSVGSIVATAVSAAAPLIFRAGPDGALVPDLATTVLAGLGVALTIAGKLALGRSFGIVPANRGVIVAGAYRAVRHPIYAGYLVTHVAFIIANPTAWNAAAFVIGDTALMIRALREERILKDDSTYQEYCRRVSWHLVPGLF